jgi:OFA family oxalate/formate antiporter-like MFS transporter
MSALALRTRLARRLPFYYGWTVFAIASSTSYTARPLMSVAVLAVFVVPMTEAFGWSRGLFSGAVSLGGLCAVATSTVERPSLRTSIFRPERSPPSGKH